MPSLTWRSMNPEDAPVLWFFLCILGWSIGPSLMIVYGRELTLHGHSSLLNALLVVAGVLVTTLAFWMLIQARRAAGIGIEPKEDSKNCR